MFGVCPGVVSALSLPRCLLGVSVCEVIIEICKGPHLVRVFSSQLPDSLTVIIEGWAGGGTSPAPFGSPERTRQDAQYTLRPPGYRGTAVVHAHVCSPNDEENFVQSRALVASDGSTDRSRGRGPTAAEVKSLPGWGVCLDWRREAAGEARVEWGSGIACGDPRRPTGFTGCRPAAVHWVKNDN